MQKSTSTKQTHSYESYDYLSPFIAPSPTRSFAYAKEASRIIIFSVFPRFKHLLENGFQTEEETKEGGDTAERSIDRLADLMRRLEDLKVKYKTLKDKVNQAVEEADKAQDAADETEEVRVVTFVVEVLLWF